MLNAFQIKTLEKSFVVLADTPEDKISWMTDIQSCIDKEGEKGWKFYRWLICLSKRIGWCSYCRDSTSRKRIWIRYVGLCDLISLAPVWVGDDASEDCMICKKRFHLLKRKVGNFFLNKKIASLSKLWKTGLSKVLPFQRIPSKYSFGQTCSDLFGMFQEIAHEEKKVGCRPSAKWF